MKKWIVSLLVLLFVLPLAHGATQYYVNHPLVCNDPVMEFSGGSSDGCGPASATIGDCGASACSQIPQASVQYNVSLSSVNLGGNLMVFNFFGFNGFTSIGGYTGDLAIEIDFSAVSNKDAVAQNTLVMAMEFKFVCGGVACNKVSGWSFDKDGNVIDFETVNLGGGLNAADCVRLTVDPANGMQVSEYTTCSVLVGQTVQMLLPYNLDAVEQIDMGVYNSAGCSGCSASWQYSTARFQIYSTAPNTGTGAATGGIWGTVLSGAAWIGAVVTYPVRAVFSFVNTASGGVIGAIWTVLAVGAGGFLSAISNALGRFGFSTLLNLVWGWISSTPDNFINFLWNQQLNLISNWVSITQNVFTFVGQFLFNWLSGGIAVIQILNSFATGGWIMIRGLFKYAQGPNGKSIFLLLICVDFAWAFEVARSRGFGGVWEWAHFHVDLIMWPFKVVWWNVELALWMSNNVKGLLPLLG